MPRKPRIDPPPLESFEFEADGEVIKCEIRDSTCIIKSRGYVNREKFSDTLWEIMTKVALSYLDENGRKNPPQSKDFLSSPSKFASQVVKWGLNATGDTSELRKVYYPEVMKQLTIFANAIEAKKKSL